MRIRHLGSGEGITQQSSEWTVTLSREKYCLVEATLNSEIKLEAILK